MEAGSERVERRLAAIFATDVAGYSRLMGQDEVGTLRTLSAHREVMDRLIVEHGGRIANTAGDSVLVEFPSAADAVQCAVETQKALSALNSDKHPDRALCFRIGVHLGDVIIRGGDIFGDGVNIAARLQALTEPGGVCISGDLHRHVRKVLPLTFTNLGAQQVKNIEEPVTVYAVDLSGSAPTAAASQPKRLGPLPLPDKPSIAVLPFINMSGDPEQDYFADGVVEDIITALSRVRWFFVIARNSSFTYKGKAVDVRQVGRELGVRYVLEGSIRRAGGRIRITGQLIEAASGRHVWADCLREGGLEDIFQLQDHITESVVGAVEPTVRFAEVERARAKPTESLDAYDLYLRALPLHYSNNRERVAEAQKLLARATEIDCDYSLAKAFSALTTVIQTNQGWTSKAEQENGIRFAREALADHRDDPVTLRCVGHALSYLAHEHDVGVAVLERALMLHPNSAEVHHSAGWVWNFACNGSKALEHFNRSMRLSPLDPEIGHTLMGLTFAQLLVGHDEEALETSKKAMAAMSTSLSPLRAAIIALIGLGYFDEAKRIGRSLFGIAPDFRVSSFHEVQPFQNKAFVDRYMTALRTAGLPE
jgi:adenylate cyclase